MIDSTLTIFAGLGLRLFMETISRHDDRLTTGLVGLWEGFVVHHYSWGKPYWDPFIACAFRLFIDFIVTRDHLRLVLVLLWTGVGLALSEVATASLTVESPSRGSRISRSSLSVMRPRSRHRTGRSRVRFDGIDPLLSADLTHTVTPHSKLPDPLLPPRSAILRNSPLAEHITSNVVLESHQTPEDKLDIISVPPTGPTKSPPAIQTSNSPHMSAPLPPSNQLPSGILIQGTIPIPVVHTFPVKKDLGISYCLADSASPHPQDALETTPDSDLASPPLSDSDLEPLLDMSDDNDATPTVRLIKLSPSVSGMHDDLDDKAIDDDQEHAPTVPSTEFPFDEASSPLNADHGTTPVVYASPRERPLPPIPIDELPDLDDIDGASTLDRNVFFNNSAEHPSFPLSPLDQHLDLGVGPDVDLAFPVEGANPNLVVLDNRPTPLAPNMADDSSVRHIHALDPDPISIADLESTTTEQESVITIGDRATVMARAETLREQAMAQERETQRLNQAMRKSFGQGRIMDGLLLEGDYEEAEKMSKTLHAKAARRYFYAHNVTQVLPPRTIDVHRLRAPEALQATIRAFREVLDADSTQLRVIVGRGNHSRGKIPVLRMRIIEDMERRNIPHRLDPSNDGVLILGWN